jgi:hypothetical protein
MAKDRSIGTLIIVFLLSFFDINQEVVERGWRWISALVYARLQQYKAVRTNGESVKATHLPEGLSSSASSEFRFRESEQSREYYAQENHSEIKQNATTVTDTRARIAEAHPPRWYYTVAFGRRPGIYNSWEECELKKKTIEENVTRNS